MKYLVVMTEGDESKVVFSTDIVVFAEAVITEEARNNTDAEFHIYERVV